MVMKIGARQMDLPGSSKTPCQRICLIKMCERLSFKNIICENVSLVPDRFQRVGRASAVLDTLRVRMMKKKFTPL